MKFHIIAGHIILALSLTAGHALSAQDYSNTPVSISKEKVKVNGTVCYSHVVLERQTLFSISKAYNVSIEELYKYNPSVKEKGLIKNSIIIIPVVEAPVQEVKTEEIKAYVVNKGMKELTLKVGELTDDEREIILKGCLINYNRNN